MSAREPNIDLIRATAIILVLIHHIGQLVPKIGREYTNLGAYGVDLFFVLSGWLIGRLYWCERRDFGNVRILGFWMRRWLRTVPPYLIVLLVAYAGVYFARNEPFNPKYLIFLQNYETTMPFFLVSWSLCVEEHFYLLLPLLVSLLISLRVSLCFTLPLLVAAGLLAKLLDPAAVPGQAFGYATTASHLNFGGLALGVWFSYLAIFKPTVWSRIQYGAKWVTLPAFVLFLLLPLASPDVHYYFGIAAATMLWGGLLATLTALPPLRLAKSKVIYLVALSSYSIYLTHGVVLQICSRLSDRTGLSAEAAAPLWLATILAVGYGTYMLIEHPSLHLRSRLAPRRTE